MIELYDGDGNIIGYYDPTSGYAEPSEIWDAQAVASQATVLWESQQGAQSVTPAGNSLVQVDELGNPITDENGNAIRYPVAASGVPDASSEYFPGGGMTPIPPGVFADAVGALWKYVRTPTGGYKAVPYRKAGAMSPWLLVALAGAAILMTGKSRGKS